VTNNAMESLKQLNIDTLKYNLNVILGNQMRLPDNYMVLDLETTGTEYYNSHIWQVGLYPVLNGKPETDPIKGTTLYVKQPKEALEKATFEITRRWAKSVGIEPHRAESLVMPESEAYKKIEKDFVNEVNDNGVEEAEAMKIVTDLVTSYAKQYYPIVGQNFVRFDCPFIEYTCARVGMPFQFPSSKLIDTGILIKSSILGRRIGKDETCKTFYTRVSNERAKGVYFALERFAIPYWSMDVKYGIDITKAHDAGYDCYVTSLVMTELFNDCIKE
jgi:DNA polymerase III epsilon subunit-like protein